MHNPHLGSFNGGYINVLGHFGNHAAMKSSSDRLGFHLKLIVTSKESSFLPNEVVDLILVEPVQ